MRGHARPYPGGQFTSCPAWLILSLASSVSLAWAEGFGASSAAIEGTTLDHAPIGEFSKVVSQVNDLFELVSAPNVEHAEGSASPYSWQSQGNWWGGKVKLPGWDGLQDRRQSDFVALNPFNDVHQTQYIAKPPQSNTPPTDEPGTPHPRQLSDANVDEHSVTTPETLREYDVTEPPPVEEGTVEYQEAGDESQTEGPFQNHKYEVNVEQEGTENAKDAEDRQDEESHADVNQSSDEEREDEPQTDVDEETRYYEGPIPANKEKDSNRSTKHARGKKSSNKKSARKSRKRGKARGRPQNAPQVTEDDVDDTNQRPPKNRAVPTVFGVNRHYQQLGFRSPFVPLPVYSSPTKKNMKYKKYFLIPKTQRKTQRRPWGRDSRAFNYRTPHAVVQLLSGPDFIKLGLQEKRRNRPPVYRGEHEDNGDGRYESNEERGNSDPEVEDTGNDSHDEDNLPQARHQLSDTEPDDAEGEITSEETSTESSDYPWDAGRLEDSPEAPQNDELEPDVESSMENYHHVIPHANDEEQAESQESGAYSKHRSGHRVKSGESGGDHSSHKSGKSTKGGEKLKDGSKHKNYESGVKGQKGHEIRRKKYKDKKGRWKSYVDEDEDSGSHDKYKKEELGQDHHNLDGYKTKKRAKGFRDKYNFDKSKSHNSFYQNRKHKGAWRHYGHADANYAKSEKGAKKGKYKKSGSEGDKKQEKHSSGGGHSQDDHKEWRGKTGHESKHGDQRRYKEEFKYKPGFYSWG